MTGPRLKFSSTTFVCKWNGIGTSRIWVKDILSFASDGLSFIWTMCALIAWDENFPKRNEFARYGDGLVTYAAKVYFLFLHTGQSLLVNLLKGKKTREEKIKTNERIASVYLTLKGWNWQIRYSWPLSDFIRKDREWQRTWIERQQFKRNDITFKRKPDNIQRRIDWWIHYEIAITLADKLMRKYTHTVHTPNTRSHAENRIFHLNLVKVLCMSFITQSNIRMNVKDKAKKNEQNLLKHQLDINKYDDREKQISF